VSAYAIDDGARLILIDPIAVPDDVRELCVWLPPPIMRPEPPQVAQPLALPRLMVAPPELADYAELCA
jgi:hypothetical protein